MENIIHQTEEFRSAVSQIQKLYESLEVKNVLSDGNLSYPHLSEKGDSKKGMSFELK